MRERKIRNDQSYAIISYSILNNEKKIYMYIARSKDANIVPITMKWQKLNC